MRVLILSVNCWPEVTGIGAVTTYRAEYLAGVGHEVEVCTTFPYYPEWKVPSEYSGKLGQKENRNGVSIFRSYAYVPNPVTPVKRILFEASFIIAVTLRALLRKRPDVLLVVSPPLGLMATAILLSRLWSIPYVYDVEDLQPDSASELGMLPNWAVKLLYRVENAAYRHARLVTTLTPSMRQKIVDKGIREDQVALFEPRMDDSFIDLPPEEGNAFRRRYDLGEKFLVTHSGNMGVKQGLDVILDAAALNRSDDSMAAMRGSTSLRVQSATKTCPVIGFALSVAGKVTSNFGAVRCVHPTVPPTANPITRHARGCAASRFI